MAVMMPEMMSVGNPTAREVRGLTRQNFGQVKAPT